MPNNTENILVINGSKEDVEKIRNLILTLDEDGELQMDFQKIYPIPKDLQVISGSFGDEAYQCLHTENGYERYMAYEWVKEAGITTKEELIAFLEKRHESSKMPPNEFEETLSWRELGDRYASNLEKYGAKNWYDWCVNNWGTKWNAYDTRVTDNSYDECLEVIFDTAWSPPIGVYEKLAEQFPKVDIEAYWSDEGSYERSNVFSS